MTKRKKRFVIAVAAAVVVLVAVAAAARAAAPGWLRGTIERVVGQAIGRDLKIAGAFDLSLSLTPVLSAADITLANAPWGSEPSMVRVARVKVALDLMSLWKGPITVRDVQIDDVRVVLEAADNGRGNWMFEMRPAASRPAPASKQRMLVIEHAAVRGFEVTYRARPGGRPVTLGIKDLDARLDPASRMIDVRAAGHFSDAPWDIAGRLGPLENLYAVRDLDQAITGHIGRSALSLSGHIHDPLTLGGPNVEMTVDGDDIAAALANFGLRSPLTGSFRAHAVLAPKGDEVDVDLSAAVGGVTAEARGRVDSILKPQRIDATVEAEGPDASVVGRWTGVRGLPPRPFHIAGRVGRDGPLLSFDGMKGRVGGTSLTVSGPLGELPRCVGTDLQVAASGTDLSELSALTRLRLPASPFTVRGRFLRRADGLAIDGAEVQLRGSTVHASGTIGEPPEVANLDLTADATGPDASWISGIARVDLPAEPFDLRGRVTWNGTALGLDGVEGRLGDGTFDVDGLLVPTRMLTGTDARVRIAGQDLAKHGSLAGLRGLPREPFEAAGRLRVVEGRIELDDVDARVGRVSAKVDGGVGLPAPLDRTSLAFRLRGPALSELAAWGIPAELPAEPFAATGRLRIDGRVYRVDSAVAEVAADRVKVDGTLGALPDIAALDVAVEGSGPSLAAIGRFFASADTEAAKRLPAEPFTVSGRIRHATAGLELQGARAEVGEAKLSADGTLAWGERWLGTDIRFAFEAPDASLPEGLAGIKLPGGALSASGRVALADDGFRFEGTSVTLGPLYAEVSGTLGAPPKLAGTSLDVMVEGPDLAAALGPSSGLVWLPADAFAWSAHVEGNTEGIASERFSGHIGQSDFAGRVAVRLEGKPVVDADLRAKHLAVADLLGGFSQESAEEDAPAAPKRKRPDKNARLIPDKPLSLEHLRAVDAHLRLAAAEVILVGVPLKDVEIAGDLRDGTLRIERFEGTGANGGRGSAGLSIGPSDGGYRLQAKGRLDGGRLNLEGSGQAPDLAPSLDVEFEVDGAGHSLHEIAASADGRALVVLGAGRIPNAIFGQSSAGLIAFMDAINPFRKSSPYTEFECGVAAAGIDQGKAAVAPISLRTDKLTALGSGKVDFGSEAIDLSWTIKPRRNVGISAGSIANPFIKLGGTLSSPALEAKPLEAAASTGAAVATVGLTIFFRGIYNRITAEKKVCVQALEKAREQEKEYTERKSAASPE